jgi:steroid 5-alpha reductase family enzyme
MSIQVECEPVMMMMMRIVAADNLMTARHAVQYTVEVHVVQYTVVDRMWPIILR